MRLQHIQQYWKMQGQGFSIKNYLPRIVQSFIAIPFLVLAIAHWHQNHMGQNIINVTTAALYLIGLDHIIMAYRWLIRSQSLEYEITFLLLCVTVLGKLFEKFNPSTDQGAQNFNNICNTNNSIILILNFIFLALQIFVIIIYTFRQIYRLMTETLLSSAQAIQRSQLDQILAMKKPYEEILKTNPAVSTTCSICLVEFQRETQCVMLPACEHIFHWECIEVWLQNKPTCPYCRNNIRLSVV